MRRPNMVAYGEGKENAQNLPVEDERENTASCMKRQDDEAEVRQRTNTKDIVAVVQSSSGIGESM
jgi:hypothetical protein